MAHVKKPYKRGDGGIRTQITFGDGDWIDVDKLPDDSPTKISLNKTEVTYEHVGDLISALRRAHQLATSWDSLGTRLSLIDWKVE